LPTWMYNPLVQNGGNGENGRNVVRDVNEATLSLNGNIKIG